MIRPSGGIRSAGDGRRNGRDRLALAILVVVVLLGTAVRLRLLDAPLDRDTGEFAYAGQLLLQGVAPYGDINNMKLPGIYAAFAALMGPFGQTRAAIHLGLLLVNAATAWLLFLLARRLLDRFGAASATAAFVVLSLGQAVRGTVAKAEHFVMLFAIAGLFCLIRALDARTRFLLPLSGLLLGTAFLMKQHGAAFAVFAAAYLVWHELESRPRRLGRLTARLAIFAGALALPFAVTCLLLGWAGVFHNFWFWTVAYAWEYVSSVPLAMGIGGFMRDFPPILGSAIAIWLLAGVGAGAVLGLPELRKRAVFFWGLVAASFLAITPGLYFRPHYFLMLLPAVALAAGFGASALATLLADRRSVLLRAVPVVVVVAALGSGCYHERRFFFEMTPEMATRTSFRGNPFVESVEIARFIEDNSSPDDRIAILGSEPQIYFYANRRAATGYIYAYPLMENQPYAGRMQEEMIREIEAARPKYIVFVRIPVSWLAGDRSDRTILRWVDGYIRAHYRPVGLVEMLAWDSTIYHWGSDVAEHVPGAPNSILVFERSDDFEDRFN